MTELKNEMTRQELLAVQNVNNIENGTLVERVKQNEEKLKYPICGEESGWKYRKYDNGTIEFWKLVSINAAVDDKQSIPAISIVQIPTIVKKFAGGNMTLVGVLSWKVKHSYIREFDETQHSLSTVAYTSDPSLLTVTDITVFMHCYGEWE